MPSKSRKPQPRGPVETTRRSRRRPRVAPRSPTEQTAGAAAPIDALTAGANTLRVAPREEPMPVPTTAESPADVLPLATGQALFDGLLSVINKLGPHYARRVNVWLRSTTKEFEYRHARDGVDAATTWLNEELRIPRLPDLRTGKNLDNDIRHVNQHYTLRVALKPIFQAAGSISDRNLRAAPVLAKVLGGRVDAETLPKHRHLAQFLHSMIGTNTVSLSQARRRVARYSRGLISEAVAWLELAAKDTADLPARARAESALEFLRREALPLVNRHKR